MRERERERESVCLRVCVYVCVRLSLSLSLSCCACVRACARVMCLRATCALASLVAFRVYGVSEPKHPSGPTNMLIGCESVLNVGGLLFGSRVPCTRLHFLLVVHEHDVRLPTRALTSSVSCALLCGQDTVVQGNLAPSHALKLHQDALKPPQLAVL